MTDFNKTISETIRTHGLQPTNKWGTMQWGENWGIGDVDLTTNVDKGAIAETITLSDTVTTVVAFNKTVSESISISQGIDDLNLTDAAGYFYIFTYPTDDSEDRANTTWSESSAASTSYSKGSSVGTDWSAA